MSDYVCKAITHVGISVVHLDVLFHAYTAALLCAFGGRAANEVWPGIVKTAHLVEPCESMSSACRGLLTGILSRTSAGTTCRPKGN